MSYEKISVAQMPDKFAQMRLAGATVKEIIISNGVLRVVWAVTQQ
jgi:hypothetical protein